MVFFRKTVWCVAALAALLAPALSANPAENAGEQRVSVDALVLGLEDAATVNLGLLVPSRWGVGTVRARGLFGDGDWRDMGARSVLFSGEFAKDITEKLYVGAGLFAGLAFTGDQTGVLGGNAGFLYHMGNWGKLTRSVVAVSAEQIGMPLRYGPVMPRVGFAALFLEGKDYDGGFQAAVNVPGLAGVLIEAGLRGRYKRVALQVDFYHAVVPTITLGYSQTVKTGGIDFLSSKGWQQSDVSAEALWQPGKAGGGRVTAHFGARDEEAPVIRVWEDEG